MAFKLFRDAGTFFVMGTEEALDMLAVGGTALADIHSNIQHSPLHATHQFALGEWRTLEMQPTHHSVGRLTLVVLNEMD